MAAEKQSGAWTAVIQGDGFYDTGDHESIEHHVEQFTKEIEAKGHRVHSVRLSVGNVRRYENGSWNHAHSAADEKLAFQ